MVLLCRAADNFQALRLVLSQCLRTLLPAVFRQQDGKNIRNLHPSECGSIIFSVMWVGKHATLGGLIARGSWSFLELKSYWSLAFDPCKSTSVP